MKCVQLSIWIFFLSADAFTTSPVSYLIIFCEIRLNPSAYNAYLLDLKSSWLSHQHVATKETGTDTAELSHELGKYQDF